MVTSLISESSHSETVLFTVYLWKVSSFNACNAVFERGAWNWAYDLEVTSVAMSFRNKIVICSSANAIAVLHGTM
jgi:hypothetical protein